MKTRLEKFGGRLSCTIEHVTGISQTEIDAVVAKLVLLGWTVIGVSA